jgi:hypothetical protein
MRETKKLVTLVQEPSETKLSDAMLRQILSWPSRVHADEVATILLQAAWLTMAAEYGEQNACHHLARAADAAEARLGIGGGGGPTHRMGVAA